MNNIRYNQIIKSLDGIGTKANVMYTNQEIIDRLIELQDAMATGVSEKIQAENFRGKDIMNHFESLAKEYSLDESDTYLRFKNNMTKLGYTIGTLIKGMSGERNARRALKCLFYDEGVNILYNIQLEDKDTQAEYDAIVIAPYGIFVIEVKNWSSPITISSNGILRSKDNNNVVYDLPGRMSDKEALLKEYLGGLFPENYYSVLLLPDERSQVEDNYKQIHISCGGGISYEIQSFSKNKNVMTSEEVEKITKIILANQKEQRAFCDVKCDEIINDYAKLMVQIEAASNNLSDETADNDTDSENPEFKTKCLKFTPWYKKIDWGNIAAGFVAVTVPTVIEVAKKYKIRV